MTNILKAIKRRPETKFSVSYVLLDSLFIPVTLCWATHPLLSAKKNQSEVNIFISNFLISSILLWWLDTQVAMATLSFLIFLKFLGEDRPPISFPCRNLSDPVPMATQRCWQCRKRESNTLWWWCIKQGHRHNLSSSSCFTYFMS